MHSVWKEYIHVACSCIHVTVASKIKVGFTKCLHEASDHDALELGSDYTSTYLPTPHEMNEGQLLLKSGISR